jgi:enamine deaminase RidA (YjgF/YER057c/UK114 family)
MKALLAAAIVLWAGGAAAQTTDPEQRLKDLGLTLPEPAKPVANYVRAVRTGNLVFLAGHGECANGQTGKVGAGVTLEQAYASARRVGLCLLSSLKQEIGDLRKVRRIVKVLGMVNATADFGDHPRVVNGFSDLMVEVFGEQRGKHARSAVGMGSLPGNITVEIEMVVEVGD